MWELVAGISGPLVGAVAALIFLVQRNSARYEAAQEKARASDLDARLQLKTVDSADSWARLSSIISDLKRENAKLAKELDDYAAKDPVLAGDVLDSVLPHQDATPVSASVVPSSTSSGGGSDKPKPN